MYLILTILMYVIPLLIGIVLIIKPKTTNKIIGFSKLTLANDRQAEIIIRVFGILISVVWATIAIMSFFK